MDKLDFIETLGISALEVLVVLTLILDVMGKLEQCTLMPFCVATFSSATAITALKFRNKLPKFIYLSLGKVIVDKLITLYNFSMRFPVLWLLFASCSLYILWR